MTLREAREAGKATGYGIASDALAEWPARDVETLDILLAGVYDCEENARQYSPFEVLAYDLNHMRDPERAWEEYEAGVVAGARAAWRLARVQARRAYKLSRA